jgi:hypothetical protein
MGQNTLTTFLLGGSDHQRWQATDNENLALTPPLARPPSPNLGEGLGVRAYFQGSQLCQCLNRGFSRPAQIMLHG